MSRRAMCGHSRTLKHIAELADAIRYALPRCEGLTRFLDDSRIELDNSPVERSIRPITTGKYALRRLAPPSSAPSSLR
jgi:Transposase IS66 family